MKNFIGLFIFLVAINLAVPVLYCRIYDQFPADTENITKNEAEVLNQEKAVVFDVGTNSVLELDIKDYLIGAAACEIPALYEENAIKAQMIAIHSYYLYCQQNPDKLENGYIQVDEKNLKGYASATRLMEFWGMGYYDYYSKFERCASEVIDKIITYNGQPAMAVYHAVSCGKTADSSDVWGENMPYLVSVDSISDQISENYLKINEFSKDTVYSVLRINYPAINIDEDKPEDWFGEIEYTQSGYASFVTVGGDKVPASQIRDIFGLQSTCMMIFYENGTFSIATKGYGHGVGLSQHGANQMSASGATYSEILGHYYPKTTLETI